MSFLISIVIASIAIAIALGSIAVDISAMKSCVIRDGNIPTIKAQHWSLIGGEYKEE